MDFSRKKNYTPPPLLSIDFFEVDPSGIFHLFAYGPPMEIHVFSSILVYPLQFQRFLLYPLEFSVGIFNRGLQFFSGKAQYVTFKYRNSFQFVSFWHQFSRVSPPTADRNVRTLHSFPDPSRRRIVVGVI